MATATRRETRTDGTAPDRRVAWWVRVFAYGFLALLVVVLARDQEWWPLTSWHLFSHVRTDTTGSNEVTAVEAGGATTAFRFAGLPDGLRLETRLLPHLTTLPTARQRSTCDAWLKLGQDRGDAIVGLRVYAVERHLPRGDGRAGAVVSRHLRLSCGAPS